MRILVLSKGEPSLDARGLPSERWPLRESDDGQALDERGSMLWPRLGLPAGPIPSDRRAETLWTAIDLHIEQIQQLLEGLSPDGLLERLLDAHEALIYRGASQRRNLPTLHACFSDVYDVQAQSVERMEQLAEQAPAVRFAIEAAAARPPSGKAPVTQSVLDRLIALASQVHSLGGVLDVLRDGLEDVSMSRLPSGRMGISREGRFLGSLDAHRVRLGPGELARATEASILHWDREPPTNQAEDSAALLDQGALAEWGCTLTDTAEAFDALAALCIDGHTVAVGLDQAAQTVAGATGLPLPLALGLLDYFSLSARDGDLLTPPAGIERRDVYPWRYARRQGLLRRPLIRRASATGAQETLIAPRLVSGAVRHALADMLDRRFAADTPQLRQAITDVGQRADEAFNDAVAATVRDLIDGPVRTRVARAGRERLTRSDGQDLGDIDVLAADLSRRRLLVLETKNLSQTRTPAEAANELANTFVGRGRRTEKITRHVERVAWAERHVHALLKELFVDPAGQEWTVLGGLVTRLEARGVDLVDAPLAVVHLGALKTWLEGEEAPV